MAVSRNEPRRAIDSAQDRLELTADHFGVSVEWARSVVFERRPEQWSAALGGGLLGGRAAAALGLDFARLACALDDHLSELQIAEGVAEHVVTDEDATYLTAWQRVTQGAEHVLAMSPNSDRLDAARRLHDVATTAIADLRRRYGDSKLRRSWVLRGVVDDISKRLSSAEAALGLEPSPTVSDLRRRERARELREQGGAGNLVFSRGPTLFEIWARDSRDWWIERYLQKFGEAPPSGFWMANPRTKAKGQVHPKLMHLFDKEDQQAYFNEMDLRFRREHGLPPKGEGWMAQTHLAQCVEEVLSNFRVVREATPVWLAPQRLDIFVPALSLAIEYQGEQHFLPLDHLGGDVGLSDRKDMDDRKRAACRANGVTLIEWHFADPISEDAVRRRLRPWVGRAEADSGA
ncbi:MAG: hypothetical protein ABSB34_07790 [Candidatus Limnocylindrales bacterium]